MAQGWHSGSHANGVGCYHHIRAKGFPTTSISERGIAVPRFVGFKCTYGNWGAPILIHMNRILTMVVILMCSIAACLAQQKEVTKFLGIPVDGTKSEMVRQLKSKGFYRSSMKDALVGEFNGRDVYVSVVTNNNKVYRIAVIDVNENDEADIKIRFNTLVSQFANNPKYAGSEDQKIPDEEDISYEMSVNSKRYEAIFYQTGSELSDSAMQEKIQSMLAEFTPEEIKNPTTETENKLEMAKYRGILELVALRLSRPVWFVISESYGKYRIVMYYDNEYNSANGEDL